VPATQPNGRALHVAERRDHVDVVRVGLGDLVEMGERLLALAHL
jgi:hypothetical protein